MIFFEFVRPHGWFALFALLIVNAVVCYRFGGRGLFAMIVLTGVVYSWLDHLWIRSVMEQPGWSGTPDQDGVFIFGVFLRVICAALMLFGTFVLVLALSAGRMADEPHETTNA